VVYGESPDLSIPLKEVALHGVTHAHGGWKNDQYRCDEQEAALVGLQSQQRAQPQQQGHQHVEPLI
jgi:hypothetical protein